MTLSLAAILIINAISFGWTLANSETANIVIPATHVGFSIYLVILAVRSVKLDTIHAHSNYILHLAALSTFAVALLGITAILPDTPPTINAFTKDVPALGALGYSRLLLYILVASITLTTRLGPPLHYRPEDIYFEKTVSSITNAADENVAGIVSEFVLSVPLFFTPSDSLQRCLCAGASVILLHNSSRVAGKRCD